MSTRTNTLNNVARPALLAFGVAALLALSGLVQAQNPPAFAGAPAFASVDTNGDGRLSADEFAQHRAQRMAARAAQGRPMRNAASAPSFESVDTNGDGYLVPAELVQAQQARFASRGPGNGRGYGAGYGPGAGMSGRPCWRNQ